MKPRYRYVIYLFLILIAVIGIGLFVWQKETILALHETSDVGEINLIAPPLKGSQDVLETTIFDDAKFIVLKNNLQRFDFDFFCRDASQAKANTNPTAAELNASMICVLGNASLFTAPIGDNR